MRPPEGYTSRAFYCEGPSCLTISRKYSRANCWRAICVSALIAARFNDFVVEPLVRGALDALKRHGVSDKQIEIVRVPGAFDIPIVARKLALSRRYEALIALGAVIRGQTPHFDYVAGECAGGIARIALEAECPSPSVC
jgi:6,7-dimethyl-8-ribityllumazine synthase